MLSYTSKHLAAIVITLIWGDIEFHEAGYHESRAEPDDPPPFRSRYQQPYDIESQPYSGRPAWQKAEALFTMLQSLHKSDKERLGVLAQRVKHLCTVFESWWQPPESNEVLGLDAISVWELLPYFSNIDSLEIHGKSFGTEKLERTIPDIKAPALRKLHYAKLWAYIPRSIVVWILRAGYSLERLDLGMLDRPISGSQSREPDFRPLPEENLAEDGEESDYGSLHGEAVIPRPLGMFLPIEGLALPKLKHLHLCRPGKAWSDAIDYTWSERAERACNDDWGQLLAATNNSLEVLVLEKRPGAESRESDGCAESDWTQVFEPEKDSSTEMVQEALETQKGFKRLQTVHLIGYKDVANNNETSSFVRFLHGRGLGVKAYPGLWCQFECRGGMTFWASWEGYSDDEDEEEEDEEDEEEEGNMDAMELDL